jgi:hypothetical protein
MQLEARVAALEMKLGQPTIVGSGAVATRDLSGPVAAMELRLRAVEERPGLKYHGVWLEGASYREGDVVTWGGSVFIAREATTAKPGAATAQSRAWTLAVKAGRDGRDAAPR